ncbi:Retrotransposon-like protein 1 [Takifugu flavidus]|uniref:Retrotransposon-like protein 1 n=1 Tax=Takifugu flavidus TaxID=433684 RepID=A0A5C6PL80_9TELE|nr:Retrotransposon-like protein 1 [Takifugu flavidus]
MQDFPAFTCLSSQYRPCLCTTCLFCLTPEATVSAPAPPPPAPVPALPRMISEPRLGAPERYNGDPKLCRPFLTSCSLLFSLQPHTFATEGAKVAYVISNLTGRALLWGTAEWERQTPACASFQAFSEELRKVFGLGAAGPEGTSELLSIRQGNQSVADYSIDFRTKARLSDWNLAALRDAFLHGLAEYIKDELVSYPLPATLDELIELSTRLDLRVRARRRERRQNPALYTAAHRLNFPSASAPPSPATPVPADPEPMQLGRTRLTPEERQRRQTGNLSKLLLADDSHTLATFIDSGSDGNIMDEGLAMQLGLERIPLNPPIPARALGGHLLGTVAHQTAPVHMLISAKLTILA